MCDIFIRVFRYFEINYGLNRYYAFSISIFLLSLISYVILKKINLSIEISKKYSTLSKNKNRISIGVKEFEELLSNEFPYFNHYKARKWIDKNNEIIKLIKRTKVKIERREDDFKDNALKLLYYFENCEELRRERNLKFVEFELKSYSNIFEDIDGNSLDIQQRKAIVINEDNNLVIAGAGSGKTSSIVGKVKYILERYKVSPEKILVISFTNKSAAELRKRIDCDGVRVSTFHKLGKDIIYSVTEKKQRVYDNDNLQYDIKRFIIKALNEDRFRSQFMRFITLYLRYGKTINSESDKQDEINTQKYYGNGFFGDKVNLRGKRLKSKQEVRISDFLFLNRVNFRYEEPYRFETLDINYAQYEPDFTIYQNGKVFYLEHFGIDRYGNPPDWFDNPNLYKQGMKWKRSIHKKYGTILIESYSYEFNDGNFETKLSEKLNQAGIELKPMSFDEFKVELKKIHNQKYLSDFIKLLMIFLNLIKSNNYDIETVEHSIQHVIEKGYIERTSLFLKLFKPIFKLYEDYLDHRNEIDFSDMIMKATKLVENNEYRVIYDFIIVDEFQDMSKGRYDLLRAIKQNNPHSILYAVGDDWQSIFRFTGSDISLLNNFEKYFGISNMSKIETTYRFANPLIKKSSEFIMNNNLQIKKELKSNTDRKRTDLIVSFFDDNSIIKTSNNRFYGKIIEIYNFQDTMVKILDDIKQNYGNKVHGKEFLILGRYNHDVSRLISGNSAFIKVMKDKDIYIRIKKYPTIDMKFLTVHRAKGLQADFVFLINCEDGTYGFPSLVEDDPILNLLLSDIDKYPYAEERRLFYVAISRAREQTHLIVNCQKPSPFIKELYDTENFMDISCPNCGIGFIVRRRSRRNGREFWGCSNFKYGCDWTSYN